MIASVKSVTGFQNLIKSGYIHRFHHDDGGCTLVILSVVLFKGGEMWVNLTINGETRHEYKVYRGPVQAIRAGYLHNGKEYPIWTNGKRLTVAK